MTKHLGPASRRAHRQSAARPRRSHRHPRQCEVHARGHPLVHRWRSSTSRPAMRTWACLRMHVPVPESLRSGVGSVRVWAHLAGADGVKEVVADVNMRDARAQLATDALPLEIAAHLRTRDLSRGVRRLHFRHREASLPPRQRSGGATRRLRAVAPRPPRAGRGARRRHRPQDRGDAARLLPAAPRPQGPGAAIRPARPHPRCERVVGRGRSGARLHGEGALRGSRVERRGQLSRRVGALPAPSRARKRPGACKLSRRIRASTFRESSARRSRSIRSKRTRHGSAPATCWRWGSTNAHAANADGEIRASGTWHALPDSKVAGLRGPEGHRRPGAVEPRRRLPAEQHLDDARLARSFGDGGDHEPCGFRA